MRRSLDMSLDDIIRKNNTSSGGRRNSNSAMVRGLLGPGPDRRLPSRHEPIRPHPYLSMPPAMQVVEPMMMMRNGRLGEESGTKLYVSNLDYGVSNEDIKVLFLEVGELKRYSIHYDRSGRSKGTAEVVFVRQADALAAIKRYNNVNLDGKPMRIEVVGLGVNLVSPNPVTSDAVGNWLGNPNAAVRSGQQRFSVAAHNRGGGSSTWSRGSGSGRGFAAKGQGKGRERDEKLTAEQLDAELEKYRLEAVKIN